MGSNFSSESDFRPVVFLGPSLDLVTATSLFAATYRRPAECGDITRAVEEGFDPIVLIDGLMVESHPPSPKEIAAALSARRRVVGAASLGAIRAAELQCLGMYGYGWVYRRYLRTPLAGDDEVLTVNCPETWRPLTVSLVRVLFGIEKLVQRGLISIGDATQLIKRVKETPFRNRTWSNIISWIGQSGLSHKIADKLVVKQMDIKRIDTIGCLKLLSDHQTLQKHKRPSHTFNFRKSTRLNRCEIVWSSPSQELSRKAATLLDRRSELGISRIGETTWLDSGFVQSYCCVAPGTTDDIWVYSGKGLSKETAIISCMLEAVERRAALWPRTQGALKTKAQIPAGSIIWGPEMFTLCVRPKPEGQVFYYPAVSAGNQYVVWVPAEVVFTGTLPIPNESRTASVLTSNGLGAGFNLEAARIKALTEVIERDILSIHEIVASHGAMTEIAHIAQWLGLNLNNVLDDFVDREDTTIIVEPTTLPKQVRNIAHHMLQEGMNVTIRALPNDYGLPAFAASASTELGWNKLMVSAGYGLNANREAAVTSAILELAQTRATDFQGGREDRHHEEKMRWHKIRKHWLLTDKGSKSSFHNISWPSESKRSNLQHYIASAERVGLSLVAFVDFPSPNGFFVSRAIVPDAETWHASAGRSRLGPRARIAATQVKF